MVRGIQVIEGEYVYSLDQNVRLMGRDHDGCWYAEAALQADVDLVAFLDRIAGLTVEELSEMRDLMNEAIDNAPADETPAEQAAAFYRFTLVEHEIGRETDSPADMLAALDVMIDLDGDTVEAASLRILINSIRPGLSRMVVTPAPRLALAA
jgi:hypothetical protein